jgi:hypothetical protein
MNTELLWQAIGVLYHACALALQQQEKCCPTAHLTQHLRDALNLADELYDDDSIDLGDPRLMEDVEHGA